MLKVSQAGGLDEKRARRSLTKDWSRREFLVVVKDAVS